MASHDHFHMYVSPGTTINPRFSQTGHTDGLSIVNTGRNIYGITFLHGYISGSTAIPALLPDDFPAPLTFRTSLHIPHSTEERLLGKYHLSLAATLGAGLRAGTGLRTGTITFLTGFLHCQVDFFLTARHSFLESDPHTGTQVGPPHGTIAGSPAAPASKQISKYVTKYIAKVCTAEIKTTRPSGTTFKGSMAELVILAPFVRIT